MATAVGVNAPPVTRNSGYSSDVLPLLLSCVVIDSVRPLPHTRVSEVDPMIGTGGPGFRVGSATPAATVPFGMVKLGPDTSLVTGALNAYHCSGYYYDDDYILGFSHVHMHGVGVADEGDILFAPTDGWDDTKTDPTGFRSGFSHDQEEASPGSYRVTLDNGISVSLSATMHAGQHAYTFPENIDPVVVIDLEHVLGGRNVDATINVDQELGVVHGYMTNSGSFSGGSNAFRIYFYAVFDTGFSGFGTWGDNDPKEGRVTAGGVDVGAWLRVTPDTDIRVGLSLVSEENALANLNAELPERDIAETVQLAAAEWESQLAEFSITGGETTERTIFWTSVYHLLQMPTQYSDVDGSYIGFDKQLHHAEGFTYHSDMSMWDTYRTAHPAYTLFYPEKANDFAQSLVTMADQGGAFPKWPVAQGDGGSMIGSPADIVLADTYIKGVRDWDAVRAWPHIRAQAMGEGSIPYNARMDVATEEAYGYYPADMFGGSVAWLQEVAWADAALAQMAVALGEGADAAHFKHRSLYYRNVFDPEIGFFHGRNADGAFTELENELFWTDEFVEGNAWHYLWLAPHDPEGLAELLGGRVAARARLETFFQNADAQGQMISPPDWYWHGNEPDIHAAYLFALWGDPSATQRWVRWIEDERYFVDPDGLAGNDDAGTLSAWYIFSALGFYPIAGTVDYVVGVPRFSEASFAVGGGRFTVTRTGKGEQVASVELNGIPWTAPTFRHDRLTAGGTLTFHMKP